MDSELQWKLWNLNIKVKKFRIKYIWSTNLQIDLAEKEYEIGKE